MSRAALAALPLVYLVLAGCSTPSHVPTFAYRFALTAAGTQARPARSDGLTRGSPAPGAAPSSQPSLQPTPTPTTAPTPTPAPASGGGSGGGGSSGGGPVSSSLAVSGTVVDQNGLAIAGATITGGGATVTTDAAGRFTATVAGGTRLLTASAHGHTTRTEAAPFAFTLPAQAPVAGTAFTLDGTVTPPARGIAVRYVDALGAGDATATDANGRYHLDLVTSGGPRLPGLLVATQGSQLSASAPRILDLDPPRIGAVQVDAAATGANIGTVALTGTLHLAGVAPAGLAPNGALLRVVDDGGRVVTFSGSGGAWPATLPAGPIPGAHLSVVLSAGSADGLAASSAERIDPAVGETWAPRLLDPPAIDASTSLIGRHTWHDAGSGGALTVIGAQAAVPSFETLANGGQADVPPLDLLAGSYLLTVWAYDQPPKVLPGESRGRHTDRKAASRQVSFDVP